MTDQQALSNALAFAGAGFPVFSVWRADAGICRCNQGAACISPGKHPIPVNGFKAGTTDPEAITRMLSAAGSEGNYGIVPAHGHIVIDVDGEGWQEKLKALGLPETLSVRTSNGGHLYFHWPTDYGPVPSQLFGWLVRSESHPGYVIGPGSMHPSGKTYTIARQNGHSTTDMLAGIATFPREHVPVWGLPPDGGSPHTTITVGEGLRSPESIPTGSRHEYLRDRARTLRGGGLTGQALEDAVLSINARLPQPKTLEEVRQAIGDVETKYGEDPVPITVAAPPEEQRTKLLTLDQLPYGPTPPPLVRGTFVAPEGWTVLYANGGTGKGLLALWMAKGFLEADPDERVMVLDYESHRWEWGNRARAMGWTQQELERVIYIDPYDAVWGKGHTLAGLSKVIKPHVEDLNVGMFIVDSYSTATASGAELGGLEGAVEFFKAGASLGRPGIVLAHTAPNGGDFPAKPFGSTFVHNLARETWAGAQTGVDTGRLGTGLLGVTTTTITVELRNKKRSVGGKSLASQLFDITFDSRDRISIDWKQSTMRPVRDLIEDVLSGSPRPMTAKAISAAIKEDSDRDVDERTIRRTIEREAGRVRVDTSTRPLTYSLIEDDDEPWDPEGDASGTAS